MVLKPDLRTRGRRFRSDGQHRPRRSAAQANALLHGDVGIQDRERHRGAKAGVDNYIVKPFNAQTLKIKIDAVFAARAAPGF